jgi:hypothetical protein
MPSPARREDVGIRTKLTILDFPAAINREQKKPAVFPQTDLPARPMYSRLLGHLTNSPSRRLRGSNAVEYRAGREMPGRGVNP